MGAKQRVTLGPSREALVRLVVPPELRNQEVDVVLMPTRAPTSSDSSLRLRDYSRKLRLDFAGFRFDRDEIHDEHDGD